jgi:hypothetical protein
LDHLHAELAFLLRDNRPTLIGLASCGTPLRKAILAAYHLDRLPTQQEVLDIADKWRPYRSLATSYLFSAAYESAEAPPVASPALSHR